MRIENRTGGIRDGDRVIIAVGMAISSCGGGPWGVAVAPPSCAPQLAWRDASINPRTPFTIADSAHPGCSRDDSTSNVCFPNDASSEM